MDNQNKNISKDLHNVIRNNLDKNNQSLSSESVSQQIVETDKDKEYNSSQTKIVVKQEDTKKKKKIKYKNLMLDIMSGDKKDEQTEKEEHLQKLQQSLGGGNFKKIDKI